MERIYPSNFEDDQAPDPTGVKAEFYAVLNSFAQAVSIEGNIADNTVGTRDELARALKTQAPAHVLGAYFATLLTLEKQKLESYISLATDYCNETLFEAGGRYGTAESDRRLKRDEKTDVYSQNFLIQSHVIASMLKRLLKSVRAYHQVDG